jgi:hypothetical protein
MEYLNLDYSLRNQMVEGIKLLQKKKLEEMERITGGKTNSMKAPGL